MEHVVFFPAADGTAFRRLPSLEEAVRLVEHLRNVEGVGDVSLHALTEVPLAFRAYYRVEVPTSVVAPPPTADIPAPAIPVQVVADAAPTADETPEPVGEQAVHPPSAPRGRDSVGSLGFFA